MTQPHTSLASAPPATRIRRRRVRLRGTSWALRDRRIARSLAAVMVALAGVYGALVYGQTHQAAYTSEGIPLGASQADAAYHLGRADHQMGQTWIYRQGGRVLMLRFDAHNGVQATACQSTPEARTPCSPVLTIGIGSDEQDMLKRFGKPVREMYSGGDKICLYPGLGLGLRLRQTTVVAIEHTAPASTEAFWRNLLWEMLP